MQAMDDLAAADRGSPLRRLRPAHDRQLRDRGRHHPHLRPRGVQHRLDQLGQDAATPARPAPRQEVLGGDRRPGRAAREASADVGRGLLAQAALSPPALARRRLHGDAVPRRRRRRGGRRPQGRGGGARVHHRPIPPARPEDGPLLPRLGRGQEAELGGPEDRPVALLLGTRPRLVRHGAGRHPRRDSAPRRRSCARRSSRSFPSWPRAWSGHQDSTGVWFQILDMPEGTRELP